MGLNLLLLLFVSFLPFTTSLLANHLDDSAAHIAVIIFGINLTLASLMVNVMFGYAARTPGLATDDAADDELRAFERDRLVAVIIQAVATLFGLFMPVVAVIIYLVLSVLILVDPLVRRASAPRRAARRPEMSIDLLLQHLQTGLVAVTAADIVSWAFNILILLALAGVVVALATDDRDPSTVLAWLFVIMLLPVIGIVAYFFIGRNYRRARKRRDARMRRLTGLAERSLAPTLAANAAFTEAAARRAQGHAGAARRVHRPARGRHRAAAGRHRGHLHGRLPEVPRAARRDGDRREVHPPHVPHLGAGRADRQGQGRAARPAAAPASQVHILYDWLSCISYKKDELKELARGGRRGGPLLQAPAADQLPQPHEDGDHRRQERVLGRHEHGPGVHRRRPAVRRVARHVVPAQRAGGAPYLMLFASTWIVNGRKEDLVTGLPAPSRR